MDLSTQLVLTQSDILNVQDVLLGCDDIIEGETDHYFADGVYVRVLKIPAGNYAVGKAHRTEHITMLIKGTATITGEDGIARVVSAPFICVSKPGKKFVYCETDAWFVNVHPTDTTDLDIIEERVIMPEQDYKTMLASNTTLQVSTGE